jgi:hypothetical protein
MADMWYKLCPNCSNYLKKADPLESGMCCACGWEEYVTAYYCEVLHRFCSAYCPGNKNQGAASEQMDLPAIR